ncbi:MAG: hypothetical protein IT304_00970 [Dehalococcoidia bacterium]|nr:hypothetical protein [Dehalococcoidia bacterium]
MATEIWDLWYPAAAAQGLPFARARLEAADRLLVHAAPPVLRVEVRDEQGVRLAFGEELCREGDQLPMTRLCREGGTIVRQEVWPDRADTGRPVIFPGGEVGVLLRWWNAEDGSEWRWTVELYNHR